MNPGLSAEMPAPNCFRKADAICFAHLQFHFCLQGSYLKLKVSKGLFMRLVTNELRGFGRKLQLVGSCWEGMTKVTKDLVQGSRAAGPAVN
jgi:hypothetical protein